MEIVNSLGMRFVVLPGVPGAPDGDSSDTGAAETLSYVMVTEVTNRQYRKFRPDHSSGQVDSFSLDRPSQPVVRVTWYDAAEFAAWLTSRENGRLYRLPTEAEWIRMCQAGRGPCPGDETRRLIEQYANISDRLDPTGPERPDLLDGHAVTAPVGSYLPNPWGVFDALGNAAEWCSDWYAPLDKDTGPSATGPTFEMAPEIRIFYGGGGPNYRHRSAKAKVVRGGSWAGLDVRAECGGRYAAHPDHSTEEIGFRLVLDVSVRPQAE